MHRACGWCGARLSQAGATPAESNETAGPDDVADLTVRFARARSEYQPYRGPAGKSAPVGPLAKAEDTVEEYHPPAMKRTNGDHPGPSCDAHNDRKCLDECRELRRLSRANHEDDGGSIGRGSATLGLVRMCHGRLDVHRALGTRGWACQPRAPRAEWVPSRLLLPIEIGHAATWIPEETGPIYTWNAKFLPGIDLGIIDLHASVAAHYHNPEWALGLGGRAGIHLGAALGGFVPIAVIADAEWLTGVRETRLGGGLRLGLGSLLTLTIVGGRELDRKAGFVGYNLALDLTALTDPVGAIVRHVPQKDAPDGFF